MNLVVSVKEKGLRLGLTAVLPVTYPRFGHVGDHRLASISPLSCILPLPSFDLERQGRHQQPSHDSGRRVRLLSGHQSGEAYPAKRQRGPISYQLRLALRPPPAPSPSPTSGRPEPGILVLIVLIVLIVPISLSRTRSHHRSYLITWTRLVVREVDRATFHSVVVSPTPRKVQGELVSRDKPLSWVALQMQ